MSSTSLFQKFKDSGVTNVALVNHSSPGAVAAAAAAQATFPLVNLPVGLRINDLPIGIYVATSAVLRFKNTAVDGTYSVLLPEGGIAIGLANPMAWAEEGRQVPDPASFIDGLRTVKSYEANGFLASKFSYAPTALSPLGGPIEPGKSCAWFVTIKDGLPVPDTQATCGALYNIKTGQIVK